MRKKWIDKWTNEWIEPNFDSDRISGRFASQLPEMTRSFYSFIFGCKQGATVMYMLTMHAAEQQKGKRIRHHFKLCSETPLLMKEELEELVPCRLCTCANKLASSSHFYKNR